jgi:hypothetical protein
LAPSRLGKLLALPGRTRGAVSHEAGYSAVIVANRDPCGRSQGAGPQRQGAIAVGFERPAGIDAGADELPGEHGDRGIADGGDPESRTAFPPGELGADGRMPQRVHQPREERVKLGGGQSGSKPARIGFLGTGEAPASMMSKAEHRTEPVRWMGPTSRPDRPRSPAIEGAGVRLFPAVFPQVGLGRRKCRFHRGFWQFWAEK